MRNYDIFISYILLFLFMLGAVGVFAQNYLREAEYYQRKGDGYAREAEYYQKKSTRL